MKNARAIFMRELRNTLKNPAVLLQLIIFPIMAFVLTELVAKADDSIPDGMFVTMFAAMFVGMTPLVMTNSTIAEDKERRSLRFLVMAGVKPQEYLLGVGGFVMLLAACISVLFAMIGGFEGMMFLRFLSGLVLGALASALLGCFIGILARNQQAAIALSTPIFMVLSFSPMLATFNETVRRIASILYTQQVSILVNDFGTNAVSPFLIILANIGVFLVLFLWAYRKRGLKD